MTNADDRVIGKVAHVYAVPFQPFRDVLCHWRSLLRDCLWAPEDHRRRAGSRSFVPVVPVVPVMPPEIVEARPCTEITTVAHETVD